jgi:hypothetical protein
MKPVAGSASRETEATATVGEVLEGAPSPGKDRAPAAGNSGVVQRTRQWSKALKSADGRFLGIERRSPGYDAIDRRTSVRRSGRRSFHVERSCLGTSVARADLASVSGRWWEPSMVRLIPELRSSRVVGQPTARREHSASHLRMEGRRRLRRKCRGWRHRGTSRGQAEIEDWSQDRFPRNERQEGKGRSDAVRLLVREESS